MMTETTIETNNNKVQISTKVDPAILNIVSDLAAKQDRTISNMVERLLKQSPQVREILEAETATASA